MAKLKHISSNLIQIINKILENENVVRMLAIDDYNPLDRNAHKKIMTSAMSDSGKTVMLDVTNNPKQLLELRVFPYHFETFKDDTRVELRVYFPMLYFKNGGHVEDVDVYFDIITHNSLYFIDKRVCPNSTCKDGCIYSTSCTSNDTELVIRPHEIAREIVDDFSDTSVGTVGKLFFTRLTTLNPSERYQVTRLVANMTTFGS